MTAAVQKYKTMNSLMLANEQPQKNLDNRGLQSEHARAPGKMLYMQVWPTR